MTTVDPKLLAEVAIGLWRARSRLRDADGEPFTATRTAYLHVQRTLDLLADAGIEVIDHQDVDFDPGISLDVVAFQPVAGLTREVVVEVLRPTVYAGGVIIQRGEVIVGTPPAGADGEQP